MKIKELKRELEGRPGDLEIFIVDEDRVYLGTLADVFQATDGIEFIINK
jgi:hypothetical protein